MVYFYVWNGLYHGRENPVINYHLVWVTSEAHSESKKVSAALATTPIYTSKSCFFLSGKVVDPLDGLHVLQKLRSACFQETVVITDLQTFWLI